MSRRRRAGGALVAALVLAALPLVSGGASPVAAVVCDNAPLPDPAPTVKVLVVGDSLSQEFAGDYTWRYRFWQAERAKGVNIDFVGPLDGLMRWGSITADNNLVYADPCFTEHQHLAIGGRDLANALSTVTPSSTYCLADPNRTYVDDDVTRATHCFQPDVVLEFMGYNDLKPFAANGLFGKHGYSPTQLLANAKQFVDEVQAVKPGTPVALSTVLSTKLPQEVVDGSSYNSMLATAVTQWKTDGLPVGLVDPTKPNGHWAGAPDDTWDGYHPNANGEMHLAWDVAAGLNGLGAIPTVGGGSAQVAALGSSIPVEPLGPPVAGVLTRGSGSLTSVPLAWNFPLGADTETLELRQSSDGVTWSSWTQKLVAKPTDPSPASVADLQPLLYEFRMRAAKGTAAAQNTSFAPLYSNIVAVDLRPIGTVDPLVVTPSLHAVSLAWAKATSADRYSVRFRRHGTGAWTFRSTTATSFPISGLVAGLSYDYQVVPVRDDIAGIPSSAVSAVAHGTVNPAVPRPTVASIAGHRLRITWARAADATRYQVRIRPAGGAWRTLGWSSTTHFTTPGLVKGRNYAIAVVAWDSYVAGRTSTSAVFRVR